MAKKSPAEAAPAFNLGDRVRIKDFAGQVGRITELRGPLGPGRAPVYRVRVSRKPTIAYIELLGDQIEFLTTGDTFVEMKQHKASPKAKQAKNGG